MQLADIDEAVSCLKKGGLVIYPTETFFGLGCLTTDDQALARVFKVKKTPAICVHGSQNRHDFL